ncbi:BON domain-containing protein [Castellaniella hirudinis]|uniref:BON domain-containing protein n=1 Tax=Castellaniella hirudinis TaxID=1144617 RepID=UPI0039C2F9A7
MKTVHHIAFAAVVGLSAAVLAGCSVANHQESVGQYVDGSVVTTKVKAQLADQMGAGPAANINVKTIRGGIVQLSGFASSESERARAGDIARTVSGVSAVHNNLVVQP